MSHRLVAALLCVLSLLVVLVGYLLYHRPDYLGLCEPGVYCLSQETFYGIAQPVYLHTRMLPPLFLLMAFVSRELFLSWTKVFAPLGVAMIGLVILADPTPNSFFFGFPDRLQMADMLVKAFAAGSILFVGTPYLLRLLRKR